MALKDLLNASKVDRYTQDGRDELNKALQADVQDVTYKTGDISQKTGLQKQPDGSWAPPKKGGGKKGAGPSPEAKKEEKAGAGSKPDAAKEIAEHREAAQYYKRKARSFSETDPSYSTYMKKAEEYENKAKELEGNKPAEKSLAGTPMKKADLNSKDPYEITHSMKPDTASEAKEMDKISAFMQEETGATLRNAILARESFYKNTKNPTPEQQEGLAALMKIQQKLGYGKPAEGPALNGQKKTVSYQEMQKGPLYGPVEGSKPAPEPKDSAPRVLTGDTRIRVRK